MTCIYIYICTYIHYIHTCSSAYFHPSMHIYICTPTSIHPYIQIHLCMSTYMHKWMTTYINVFLHTCTHIFMYTLIHNHAGLPTYILRYIYTHACLPTYLHTYGLLCPYICTCIHTYMIHAHIHTSIDQCIWIPTSIHMDLHTYISCMHTSLHL